MLPEKPRKRGGFLATLVTLVIGLGALYGVVTYRQTVVDLIQAWQYRPSLAAANIRDDLALTDQAKLYFDASFTTLQTAEEFNKSCQQHKETNNPILGCYYMQRIFVFDVTNKKLEGIEQTTAAHEILHAVYERLSDSERQTVNVELRSAYERIKNNELVERMKYYEKHEPGEENNELHSILGSEFDDLGPQLEAHYKKYFANRKKVVQFYKKYSSVFAAAKTKLDSLSTQINEKAELINKRIRAYNTLVAELEQDVEDFNGRSRQVGGFSSQGEFNTARNGLVTRQNSLNSTRQEISSGIKAVDQLRDEYNELAKNYNELHASINSTLTPTLELDSVK